MPAFCIGLKIKRMRLVGNGEEIRLRLNECLSEATQGQ